MNIHVLLKIPMRSKNLCLNILEALEPDNLTVPRGITIHTQCDEETLVVLIDSKDTAILTVRNTVDDVIVHINLALRTLSLIDKEGVSMNAFKLSRIDD